jgi:antitoxin (DNA-binding transcriptional repressor) of toxin-antitoxin stability system
MYNRGMETMNISEFRETCLTLVDQLPAEGIVITRRGSPVAKILPIRETNADLIGILEGCLQANPNDDLFTTGRGWEAEQC